MMITGIKYKLLDNTLFLALNEKIWKKYLLV